MAFLVPLLLPGVINATANIALGVTNAVQGTSSNVSIKIGDRVFTTNKPFPFQRLPEEVRREIILTALALSQDLIVPSSDFVPLRRPFQPPSLRSLQEEVLHNPLNPDNPHYRSVIGEERSANGYPISSWKWQTLSAEWRGSLRKRLWRRCMISGRRGWLSMRKMMDREDFDLFTMVQELELHQGFEAPMELYLILRHPQMTNVQSVSIMPRYPFSPNPFEPILHPFDFGLQLVPAPPPGSHGLRHFELGLPLDMCTNKAQRQHLKELRLESLAITVIRPDVALFRELADLLADSVGRLSIRYFHFLSATSRELCDPAVLVCEPLDRFKKVDLHLPWVASSQHVYVNRGQSSRPFADRVVQLITDTPDESRLFRYSARIQQSDERSYNSNGGSEQVLYEPPNAQPAVVIDAASSENEVAATSGSSAAAPPAKKDEHWARETNLKLLGGLISLRLESKKH